MLELLAFLGVVYVWGFACGFVLGFVGGLITSPQTNPLLAVTGATFFGLFMGAAWPLFVWVILDDLQAEHGIFWRTPNWKPRTIIVLEILHTEGRWMTGREIVEASHGRLPRGRIYALLCRLKERGYVISRRESLEEARQRSGPAVPPIRQTLFKITESGQRRRIKKEASPTREIWDALPRPV